MVAAPGPILSYIQVDHAELEGMAKVRFDCLVDAGFEHDLLNWDGAGWSPLVGRDGQLVEGRSGGRPLQVHAAGEAAGHVVVEVDHASSFDLTSTPPAVEDDSFGAPESGGLAIACLLVVAAGVARRR